MKNYFGALFFVCGLLISVLLACQSSTARQNLLSVQNVDLDRLKIAVISDFNSQYGSTDYEPEITKAIDLITTQWQPDLVLGGGDAIAGQKKTLTEARIKAMWQAFDDTVAKPLREKKIPYAFTIGNHDGSGARVKEQFIFEEERDLASNYWNDSRHNSAINFVDKANFPFYFSFQQHDLFYLVWDASTNRIAPQQLAWVENSLHSDIARQAKMRIVIGHLPLYAVAETKNKPGEYLAEAEKLRSLLEKYEVSTYISGHHHAYYPGQKGLLQLLNTGALGQGARQLIDSKLPPRNTITLLEIDPAAKMTTYTTYDIKTLEIIQNNALPRLIIGENGLILRRDIFPKKLTTLEKQKCLQKLKPKLCEP